MSRRTTLLAVACCLLPASVFHAQEWKESPFHREGFYFGIAGAYLYEQGLQEILEDNYDAAVGAYNLNRKDPKTPVKSAQVSTEGSVGINARAGYRFLPWLATEIQLEYAPPMQGSAKVINSQLEPVDGVNQVVDTVREELRSTHELVTTTLNLKFLFPLGRVQPYALGGGGIIYSQTTGSYLSFCVVEDKAACQSDPPPVDLGAGALEEGIAFGFRAGGGLDLYLTENVLFNWEASAVIPTGPLQNLNYYSFIWGLQYRF
jgi:opacity protein-like surface antigen